MCRPTLLYASWIDLASRDANAVQVLRMISAFSRLDLGVALIARGRMSKDVEAFSSPDMFSLISIPNRLHIRLLRPIMIFAARLSSAWLRPVVLYSRSANQVLAGIKSSQTAVIELHSIPVKGNRQYRSLKKLWAHTGLRRVVTISQALADDLLQEFGPLPAGCDIVVAHDGAETGPRLGPAGKADGPIKVGYFGHLYPGKGMEMIAELAPLLPELNFDVFGGAEADLARWRTACSGQDNLTLYGHIPHAEVASRMADCDILIAPYATQVSHVGGGDIGRWMSPLKLFEYLAAERPIVTSDLPVLREVVRDGKTALLCPPEDTEAFATALRRLAADPELRARIGSAGRDLLEAEYTWEKRARRVLDGIVELSDQ